MEKPVISFDLWNTLIRSNPESKNGQLKILIAAIEELIGKELHSRTILVLMRLITRVNSEFDNMTVENPQYDFNYIIRLRTLLVRTQIIENVHSPGFKIITPSDDFIEVLFLKLKENFLEHPPLLMYSQLPNHLSELAKKYTLVLNSNTGVMGGLVMMLALEKIDLFDCFTNFIFSDISYANRGYAKPDIRSFNALPKLPIIHIGDNKEADTFKNSTIESVINNWNDVTLRLKIDNLLKCKD